ncbi:MAG: ABC transporter ATP-binding protein [Myxococcales bacterium]|nr:ABC transporter ATP-binding protein [Myxococcales bacterium]
MKTLQARGLSKTFGNKTVLRHIDFCVEASTFTAVLGENGSGKSTLLRILAGLCNPSKGSVEYGLPSGDRKSIRRSIGFVGHDAMAYADLTGRENLWFFGSLYGLSDLEARIAELTTRFSMPGWLDQAARTYSRGQRQRLALARAMLHSPRLLLLDEPLSGLDEGVMLAVLHGLREEQRRGCIIMMSTHDVTAIASLRPQLLRLYQGKILRE